MAKTTLRDKLINEMRHSAWRRECYRPKTSAERVCLVRMMAKEQVVRPVRNGYLLAKDWDAMEPVNRHICKVRTLGKAHPNWVFCGLSAAVIWGFDVTWDLLDKVDVVAGPDRRRETDDVRFHRPDWIKRSHEKDSAKNDTSAQYKPTAPNQAPGTSENVCFQFGVNVTSRNRTLFDCLRDISEPNGLALADCATRKCKWRNDHILNYVERMRAEGRRYRGVRKAELVSSYADGRAESGGESILRMNVLLAGFELPELQVEVFGPANCGKVYRVDQMWLGDDGVPIVGELDGNGKRTDERMTKGRTVERILFEERMRESRISATGARIMRVSYELADDVDAVASLLASFGVPKRHGTLRPKPKSDFVMRGNAKYHGDGEHRLEASYDRLPYGRRHSKGNSDARKYVVSREHSWYGNLVQEQLAAMCRDSGSEIATDAQTVTNATSATL